MKKQTLLRLTMVSIILLHAHVTVFGQEQALDLSLPKKEAPDAALVVVDVIPIRILGLAATVVGAGLFLVTLPFTVFMDADTNSESGMSLASEALVFKPARFTFTRPLGKFDHWDQDYEEHSDEDSTE